MAAITGERLSGLLADVAKTSGEENPSQLSYPPNLWEPYRTRRFANGEDLYRSIGIPREDKAGRFRQLARNAQFFGAPVGILVFIDERMGPVQWMDLACTCSPSCCAPPRKDWPPAPRASGVATTR